MAMRITLRSRTTTRRAPRVLSLLGAGLLGLTLAGLPTPASAHGVAMEPGSRSYLCYKDMIASGNQTPSNPACAAAVAQTGTTPLYNWFGVLDSNGGGRTKGYIPDGELCSGGHNGPYNFSSYNAARSDWPTTHLTAGSTIQVKYSNWAAHPGKFDVYLTKDGWTPDQPLAWDDLTLTQTVNNPRNRVARARTGATTTGTSSSRRAGQASTCCSSTGSARTARRTSTPAPTSPSTAATARSPA